MRAVVISHICVFAAIQLKLLPHHWCHVILIAMIILIQKSSWICYTSVPAGYAIPASTKTLVGMDVLCAVIPAWVLQPWITITTLILPIVGISTDAVDVDVAAATNPHSKDAVGVDVAAANIS